MRSRHILVVLLPAVLLAFGACQAIFTYSPLSGLQRPPSSMTPAQRLTYAQDALASGDTAAMTAAYQAIMNDTSSPAQYVAAQLGIELSGVPTVLRDLANNPSNITAQLNTIDAFITSHNLDPALMVAAAGQLQNALVGGAALSTMDYAMGSMGLLLGDAYAFSSGASWDITPASITNAQRDAAGSGPPLTPGFLAPAVVNVASLPSGDPLKDFITQMDTFISGL